MPLRRGNVGFAQELVAERMLRASLVRPNNLKHSEPARSNHLDSSIIPQIPRSTGAVAGRGGHQH